MKRLLVAILLLLSMAPAHSGHDGSRNTSTTVQCLPATTSAYQAVTCTAFVQDQYGVAGQREAPTGTVTFSVIAGPGNLGATSCSLNPTGAQGQSSCSVSYTPTAGGTHTIGASYSGAASTNFAGNWLPSNGSGNVVVNNPMPSIVSVNPVFGLRGGTLDVTISGDNFASNGVTVSFGANITVNNVTWVGPANLTVNITIDSAAATGPRDVVVTNPVPAGGSATLTNGFEVRNPSPVINNLVPAAVEEGSGAVIVTINGSGFVSDSIAYFNGTSRTTTFVNSTQLQMSLTAADTATIASYPVHVENATPGGGMSNTAPFSVVASGGSFDTVEPNAALGTTVFTKLAGVAFGVDVLATEISRLSIETGFTGTVKIELLDASDDSAALDASGCRASWIPVQGLPDQAFTAADNGRININTSYANALRVARFRISYPATGTPTHIGCSSDAFSIRPIALAVSSPLTNTSAAGMPVHAAGAPFTITASAIPGYDGTPQLDTSWLSVPSGVKGNLGGGFNAASAASGTSTGNSFTYSEVGSFALASRGIYDSNFTAVDQPNDCKASFSNTLVDGKYGCAFGSATDLNVGRFVPAYFDVAVADTCMDAGGFTYSRQPFTVTVTAREAGGGVTRNYAGSYARNVTLSDAGDASRFMGVTNIIPAMDFITGVATNPATAYEFAVPETPYTVITLRATDPDGVSSAGHLEESTEIRSARFVIDKATAITTNDGLVGVRLQAWRDPGTGTHEWAVHTDDVTCTTPGLSDFSLDPASFSGNLAAGETAISGFFFNAGQGALTLSAPGTGNDGSVNILVNLDDWLKFDWGTTGTRVAPVGTMTFFEIFQTEEGFIERHEIVP